MINTYEKAASDAIRRELDRNLKTPFDGDEKGHIDCLLNPDLCYCADFDYEDASKDVKAVFKLLENKNNILYMFYFNTNFKYSYS